MTARLAEDVQGKVTLICNVTRGNPTKYSYSWFYDRTPIPDQSAATLNFSSPISFAVDSFTCVVRNAAGAGMDNLLIDEMMFDPYFIEELIEMDNTTAGEHGTRLY